MSETAEPVVLLAPVLNFDCEIDIIELDNTLSLRRIGTSEIDNMLKQCSIYENLKTAIGKTRFVIEKRGFSDEISPGYFEPDEAGADEIRTTFRLLGIENTLMPISFYVSATAFYVSTPYPEQDFNSEQNILKKEQIEEFKLLWKEIKKAKEKENHLFFALSQFDRSFGDSNEEQFVDYITAFESIVFGRGTNPPSPYGRTIGIAIGMLIGNNEKGRIEIESKLNQAYETRNKVVHGHLHHKFESTDEEEQTKLLEFTKQCLINSLKKLLKQS